MDRQRGNAVGPVTPLVTAGGEGDETMTDMTRPGQDTEGSRPVPPPAGAAPTPERNGAGDMARSAPDPGEATDLPRCRFPGCHRPVAVPAPGQVGRPSAYCDDPGHTRAAAYRARRHRAEMRGRAVAGDEHEPLHQSPVSAARYSAKTLLGRTEELADRLLAGLQELAADLRVLGDPEAAEVEIATVTAVADQRRADAVADAAAAETARLECQRQLVAAEAAAVRAEDELETFQVRMVSAETARQQLDAELAGVRAELATAVASQRELTLALSRSQEELAAAQERTTEVESARADSLRENQELRDRWAGARAEVERLIGQLEAAGVRSLRAEQELDRCRSMGEDTQRQLQSAQQELTRVQAELAAAAVRAEAVRTSTQEQVARVEAERDAARAEARELATDLGQVRTAVARVEAERDAARAEAERERRIGDQRVADLRRLIGESTTGTAPDRSDTTD